MNNIVKFQQNNLVLTIVRTNLKLKITKQNLAMYFLDFFVIRSIVYLRHTLTLNRQSLTIKVELTKDILHITRATTRLRTIYLFYNSFAHKNITHLCTIFEQ